ncbi:transmembrane prolyl 4-hydroxylase-like [Mercenaria mercenaria]|uniref:transmembrane prolyl 4-hydroxylase-like n=1 Tax=Mercenaria mercenaria TaxID=6596 RepID=UPI00234F9021|nr:transmembrane prolyl 4-hydroxylase-like [Mercenaria mercenaria]
MEFKMVLVFCLLLLTTLKTVVEACEQQGIPSTNDGTCSRDTCINRDVDNEPEDKHNNYKVDADSKETDKNNEDVSIEEGIVDEDEQEGVLEFRDYEFQPLARIIPGKVGDVEEIELEEGKFYKRITRSVNPPIFEIPNYLSVMECNMIISAALYAGLETSAVVGHDINEERNQASHLSEMSRVSEQTWLSSDTMPKTLWRRLVNRLSKLTQLPVEHLEVSEQMQVVSYVSGGHYHAHIDSTDTTDKLHLPCCAQTPECLEVDISTEGFEECCRICRYMTVLYYLSDVEEGGETAFPLADMPDDLFEEKFKDREFQSWHDLSNFCYNASVVVKPKRGTAIMWYNHLLDENGYLGHVDMRSNHGGCDIIKGNKWIANNWIAGTSFRDRNKPSMIY